jgi:hypothetical protein
MVGRNGQELRPDRRIPALLLFTVDNPSSGLAVYTAGFKIRFVASFLVVLGLSYAFENIREQTQETWIPR